MKNGGTFKDNIDWLINQYKNEIVIEESKELNNQDLEIINAYNNIIIELEYLIELSR